MDYAGRRERLMATLPEYSISVFTSGNAPYSIGDEKYPFKVNRSFYYFTGLDKEGMTLMLLKMPSGNREVLFIQPFDETKAKWVGGRIRPAEATEISGIKDVRFTEDFMKILETTLTRYGTLNSFSLWGDLTKQELSQPNETVDLFNKIRQQQPDVIICNIFERVTKMRLIKDEEEIACIRKALEVTNTGIQTMMSYSRENIWENELEAYFDYVLKCNQCEHAFATICATGKNATVLHYTDNNQFARMDDMVLCDLGAAYQNYNADITRTFPINGHFTERQKQIYDIVLRGNKLVISLAKPGVTTRELNDSLIEFYQTELANIGLLENGKTVRDYYWHGVSHQLGLETHDVQLPNRPLEPGCIITVEPGLYLEQENIGVRIEDDVLITENGCEVLSKDIIKEIDEIESFMANHLG